MVCVCRAILILDLISNFKTFLGVVYMEIKLNNQDVCGDVARVLIYFCAKNSNNWVLSAPEKTLLGAIVCSFSNITKPSCLYSVKLADWPNYGDDRLSEDGHFY